MQVLKFKGTHCFRASNVCNRNIAIVPDGLTASSAYHSAGFVPVAPLPFASLWRLRNASIPSTTFWLPPRIFLNVTTHGIDELQGTRSSSR